MHIDIINKYINIINSNDISDNDTDSIDTQNGNIYRIYNTNNDLSGPVLS